MIKLNSFFKRWPSYCLFCDDIGIQNQDICEACFQRLLNNKSCCVRCATPLAITNVRTLCGQCQCSSVAFDWTHAPFLYQDAIRFLIIELKFNHAYKNARLLGQLLADQLTHFPRPQCIIPVPLHQKRYRQRGFNQCLEIAKTLGKQLHLPVESGLCVRHRNTPCQMGLGDKARRKNVNNAFSIIKRHPYTHIALLDDVMTTGSTLQALASIFKQAGATTIELWVCARA